MKFVSIYLKNYIGVYNGMGLSEIRIDFSRCKHKTIIIRGDNGSGKSTIMNALNLLPDSNESFIPEMEAMKEIVLSDNDTIYKILCVHGIKSNGERETTKAYISIIKNGQTKELNSNGNVTSFKDILYDELRLDSNFTALSQLSMEDKGLVDKKPAERKKFVNSIIESLEVFNNIYKSLSKKSTFYKSMIGSITAKIGNLGDEQTLRANYNGIQSRIDQLNRDRDQTITNIASYRSSMGMLDPDGKIQMTNAEITTQIEQKTIEMRKQDSIIRSCYANGIKYDTSVEKEIERVIGAQNECNVIIQMNKNELANKMADRETESKSLQAKIVKLKSMDDSTTFEEVSDAIAEHRARIEEIEGELSSIGISNISSISKDEFITALNTAKSIKEMVDNLKSGADYKTLEDALNKYMSNQEHPDANRIQKRLDELVNTNSNTKLRINSLQKNIELLDKRPRECSIDNCTFISYAVSECGDNPEKDLENLIVSELGEEKAIISLRQELEYSKSLNECWNSIANIVRTISTNSAMLLKIPNGKVYSDPITFFNRFMNGDSFEEINRLYSYLDYSNLFEEYKILNSTLSSLMSDLNVLQSRNSIFEEIMIDIDSLQNKISSLTDDVERLNQEISVKSSESIGLGRYLSALRVYKDALVQRYCLYDSMRVLSDKAFVIRSNMGRIEVCSKMITEETAKLHAIEQQIDPAIKEREKISHSLSMIEDYKKELNDLNGSYQYIETVKYYSSPTTGIQLVFMELYMGKIISLANELLGLLFNGEYIIQPFIINENEFRIPCIGSGYMNDDISSMSSAQKAMISMILSFALLHNSSTRYNIIKLDEIDAPLDENNRIMFIDVLSKIMGIMGTEQAIMISHNSEVQLDNSDVILLRTDNKYASDYSRGNVIWKFN